MKRIPLLIFTLLMTSYICATNNSTNSNIQAFGPGDLGLAISPDGKLAYISFSGDDALLVVDLTTFTVVGSINVSVAGIQLNSGHVILTPDGKKLYVCNYATKNVMVVDTYTKQVTKVLPIQTLFGVSSSISPDGSKIYIPSFDGGLYIVNTDYDSYQRIYIPGICFGPIAPSQSNPTHLYTVGRMILQGNLQSYFFTFDIANHTVERSIILPNQVMQSPTNARRLVLNSDETIAYFGWIELVCDKGIGNLVAFDLTNFEVTASTPAEYGVADFTMNEALGKIYVIGFWSGGSSSGTVPILEWDMSMKKFVRNIPLTPSSDQRAIAIDPTNSDFLYETDGDLSNNLRKIQISTGNVVNSVKFNENVFQPRAIIRDGNIGYVFGSSQSIYKLDLGIGQLIGKIIVPVGFNKGWGFYQGKLYVCNGSNIFAVNPFDGSIIQKYPIGLSINPHYFTFLGDRMAAIDNQGMIIAKQLVIFDARTMTLLKTIPLPNEPHGDKVIASPDGSKFYIASGSLFGGTTTITVFSTSTLEPTNIIAIPPADQRHGATSFLQGEFDEENRILYLLGFESVYKIDMDTDGLLGILDLIDIFDLWGRRGWTPTGLAGISLSSAKDKLFVASGDSHSLYSYDIVTSSWMTKITNLEGYFITDGVSSLDRRYFYTANSQSDNITMVDLTSGDVVKVIDLNSYPNTGVEDNKEVPRDFSLSQNYPNPFYPTTIINFFIPKSCFVTLKIYDSFGREVTTLVNEKKSVGNYSVKFEVSNLSSGIYYYQIKFANFCETKKMVLFK